jgi:hypothetical protein
MFIPTEHIGSLLQPTNLRSRMMGRLMACPVLGEG